MLASDAAVPPTEVRSGRGAVVGVSTSDEEWDGLATATVGAESVVGAGATGVRGGSAGVRALGEAFLPATGEEDFAVWGGAGVGTARTGMGGEALDVGGGAASALAGALSAMRRLDWLAPRGVVTPGSKRNASTAPWTTSETVNAAHSNGAEDLSCGVWPAPPRCMDDMPETHWRISRTWFAAGIRQGRDARRIANQERRHRPVSGLTRYPYTIADYAFSCRAIARHSGEVVTRSFTVAGAVPGFVLALRR